MKDNEQLTEIISNIDLAIKEGKDNAADKKRIGNKKELLCNYINDYLKESQLDVLQFIIDIANRPFDKHTMAEFIQSAQLEKSEPNHKLYFERLDNYDTAYPVNYFREIEQIYPEAINGNYVYDYSNLSFGRLVNLNNLLVRAIIKKMKA